MRVPHIEWEDSTRFGELLLEAVKVPGELYYILYWLRDVGTRLEPDPKFNYKLVPVIEPGKHWESQEEYNKEKKALLPYLKQLEKCLRRIQ